MGLFSKKKETNTCCAGSCAPQRKSGRQAGRIPA